MPDTPSSEDPLRTTKTAETAQPAAPAELAAGAIWGNKYEIEELLDFSSVTGRRRWAAHTLKTRSPVVLVDFPPPERRARAALWPVLTEYPVRHLQFAREVRGECIEVYDAPHGQPLTEWRATQDSLPPAALEALLRQCGEALHALHQRNLVHFSVGPQSIFIHEDEGKYEITLAGLESISAFPREDPVHLSPDPYTAPPEAIGLFKHASTPVLCAWDWWSLGRTLQTCVLGQPVLGAVLKRDITRMLKQFQTQAAELTQERLAGAMHAGAVEAMGTLDERLEALLKGLLTFNPDGRWSWAEVEQWLHGKTPDHYYDLPRSARLFRWNNRGYTIRDAARALSTPEHWTSGIEQVFAPDDPATLLGFVNGPQGDSAIAAKMASLVQLATSSTFSEYPPSLVREVVGALALMELGQGRFHWRGELLSAENLRRQLGTREVPERFNALHLLSRPKILQQLRARDGTAERFLREFAQTAEEAEAIIAEHQWFDLQDHSVRAHVWGLALGPEGYLDEALEKLRKRYASSTEPEVEALLKRSDLSLPEKVVLAATAHEPERFGYVSHAARATAQRTKLLEEGARIRDALFWRQLGAAVQAGFMLFAHWPVWLTLLFLFAVVGLVARPGPGWALLALAPLVGSAVFRFLLQQVIADLVAEAIPAAAPWRWKDGAARCRREARARHSERFPLRLSMRLREINRELARLTLTGPPPEPLRPAPGPRTVWIATAVTWAFLGSLGSFYAWSILQHPPSWPEIRLAWTFGAPSGPEDADSILEIDAGGLDVPEPDATTADVSGADGQGHGQLTPEASYAIERGRALVAELEIEPKGHPIAVLLPGETIRLMLYDAVTEKLFSEDIFMRAVEPEVGDVTLGLHQARYFGP